MERPVRLSHPHRRWRRCADVFVVTRLERFARSIAHLMAVLQAMDRKRVVVRILNLDLDTQTPTGKLRLAGSSI